jgi:hypothetical protein
VTADVHVDGATATAIDVSTQPREAPRPKLIASQDAIVWTQSETSSRRISTTRDAAGGSALRTRHMCLHSSYLIHNLIATTEPNTEDLEEITSDRASELTHHGHARPATATHTATTDAARHHRHR